MLIRNFWSGSSPGPPQSIHRFVLKPLQWHLRCAFEGMVSVYWFKLKPWSVEFCSNDCASHRFSISTQYLWSFITVIFGCSWLPVLLPHLLWLAKWPTLRRVLLILSNLDFSPCLSQALCLYKLLSLRSTNNSFIFQGLFICTDMHC